jgi:hypothetical protein
MGSVAFRSRRFEFQKRRQLFIRAHNETLSVAMRVSNKDHSPVAIIIAPGIYILLY